MLRHETKPMYRAQLLPGQRFCAWLCDGSGQDLARGNTMVSQGYARTGANLAVVSALTVFLGACSSFSLGGGGGPSGSVGPGGGAEVPATGRAGEAVGD